MVGLTEHLGAAGSLPDLAGRLGRLCLDHGGDLADLLLDPEARAMRDRIEQTVEAMDAALWTAPGADGGFTHVLDHDKLGELVDLASAQHPMEQLAVLRGLCRRALPHFFLATEDRLVLDRGMPVPFVERPINRSFPATPYHETLTKGHLLEGLGYRLFEHPAGGKTSVVLDFSVRDRLDELTWAGKERLPRIATLHPFLGAAELEIGDQNEEWFFDVRPRVFKLEEVLAQLKAVQDAEIAVLPELCLPLADALEAALAADHDSYPPLVVAGSAHVREPDSESELEIRANESRIYLDGRRVATHRKIHPFATKDLGGRRFARALPEGLTPERKAITVLSGSHTRLAIAICADLNDDTIPTLLVSAGVNLLLVPALTAGPGAFNGTLCALASQCQAVAVVVNAALDPQPGAGDDRPPFLVMAAVPRASAKEQSDDYSRNEGDRPSLGVFDPNLPLDQAMTWREAP